MTSGTSVSMVFKVSTKAWVEVPWAKLRKPASSITGPSATGSEKGIPTSIAETPNLLKSELFLRVHPNLSHGLQP